MHKLTQREVLKEVTRANIRIFDWANVNEERYETKTAGRPLSGRDGLMPVLSKPKQQRANLSIASNFSHLYGYDEETGGYACVFPFRAANYIEKSRANKREYRASTGKMMRASE